MTDKEIIKALETIEYDYATFDTDQTPLVYMRVENAKAILDLIKRQQAEIEALINGQETLQKMCAEAYNEFAERLKARYCIYESLDTICADEIREDVEDLVKELTEGSNDERRMD